MTEIVGVIPAAGYATRLQPLQGSKEVLLVGGRPVMDYLADRMRRGGCTRLRVVTRAEKKDVVTHSAALGAEVVLAEPATVSESLLAGMDDLASNDIVLIGFPDSLWEPVDGFKALVRAVRSGREVALGLFRVPTDDLRRSDVVKLNESGRVLGVQVKPRDPPSDWIWGCAAARVGTLAGLAGTEWPGGYFDQLCAEGRDVEGYPFSDEWLDLGTKGSLREAEVRYPSCAEL